MARDIAQAGDPAIVPGDSVVVTAIDAWGVDVDSLSGAAAVYCWVRVNPAPGSGGKTGEVLIDDPLRWPVADSTLAAGRTWYRVQMDTAFTGPGRTGPVPDRYCVDLNETLFEPGDTILYFFHAKNTEGDESYWNESVGHTRSIEEAAASPMEFQIMPGGGYLNGGDILYVDDSGDPEVRQFFETAFRVLGIEEFVDRYDVRGPAECASNSPGGSGVKNVHDQLIPVYRRIIWSTGDLRTGLLGDGTGAPEKADDCGLLFDFLYDHTAGGGVYITGNNVAEEWSTLSSTSAGNLRNLMPYNFTDGEHWSSGLKLSPLIVAEPGTMFDHPAGPDDFIAFHTYEDTVGCDVIEAIASAATVMRYQDDGIPAGGAVVSNSSENNYSNTAAVILSGFSFHRIRDDSPDGVMDRDHHMADILSWLGDPVSYPVGAGGRVAYVDRLGQNRPNPFNPTTTIEFSLRAPAHVTLSVYNVRGQLVRVLLDEKRQAGLHKDVVWDGRNGAEETVASGIYFYRLVAGDYRNTKKMVLLK
jgi:hypothetical protein